ncbi:glycoside hydrolase family 3 protein [Georgenia muralis]|uniref:beta-glucosidase n=1 Tax=Georgenia muralis TaxID=154117 RepID=A0A3N4Z773_9MICO|nr:glycoside hydrolase family 3 N-terminal domain-containing protein [Georgenia muralis]RPF27864.1 beta-glucosidase [Georgenia muralis]
MTSSARATRRRGLVGLAVAIPLTLSVGVGAVAAPSGDAPDNQGKPPTHSQAGGVAWDTAPVEARVKRILLKEGEKFKDLNGNNKLDPYEDWREHVDVRVADLVGQMTLEEKAGLMLIDTLNAECIDGDVASVSATGLDYIDNQNMHRLIFRNVVSDEAVCGAPGGGFQASTRLTPADAATFMNRVQEVSEGTRLGIPVLYKSNARNHIDPQARAGINESAGAFSAFPKEAGIAAAALGEQALATGEATDGDMSVVDDFAGVMADEWASIGLRGMYGYMADLSTEPRWYRTHETFTEDADLGANIMGELVETLQGPVGADGNSLSPETAVALTMKHFPGGGPQELGLDPHYAFGKTQVYPGDAFGYHLKPFEAAIEAGVSSIMPYYGVPMDVSYEGIDYDEVGMAFSDQIVNGLLREQMGFAGYVNSDTGIINDRAWGFEEATIPERVAAAINGGTDTLSGFHDVATITDLVADGLVSEERVTLAAERLLAPMFEMGLFENPYVDPEVATATVGNDENRATALDLQRRSAVLLQNTEVDGDTLLPLETGSSLYVLGNVSAATAQEYGYDVTDGNTADPADRPSAEGSDAAVISVTVNNTGTGAYRSNDPATGLNEDDLSPIVWDGALGLDGQSPYGAADACVAYGASSCTDNGLRFGGSYPWESSILDFTGMAEAQSWTITPSLDTIQAVMDEVGAENVVLDVYFRQPYVLDEASGLRDAGAILANFGSTDRALLDVLSGEFAPQGRLPFALPASRLAVEEQYSDLPGYEETADGALFPYGFGLTYDS